MGPLFLFFAMLITVTRKLPGPDSTIGTLEIDGHFFCDTLEDTDRGLDSSMSLEEIARRKVYAQTAIPTGEYLVHMQFSQHFGKMMPYLQFVPGYDGVMIHPLNTPAQTKGCIGVGTLENMVFISDSGKAFARILPLIEEADNRSEEIRCRIQWFKLEPAPLITT